MLWWLVDYAKTVYFFLGIAALVLIALWWMNRRAKYLIGVGVVIGLAALVWLLGLFIVTDRMQIRANILAMKRGVEQGNPDAVFRHFSKSFTADQWDRKSLEARAGRFIEQRRVHEIVLWDFDFEVPPDRNNKAVVAFRVRAIGDGGEVWYLCRADFVFEEGDWRMKTIRFFNPVADTDRPIPIPVPN
jgi:hypothetical protein